MNKKINFDDYKYLVKNLLKIIITWDEILKISNNLT